MITIKQREESKWKLFINDEEWNFKDRKEMETALKQLLDLKVKNGSLVRKEKKL